jgi:hypothetical protein
LSPISPEGPLFTIITTTFNAGERLDLAIDSVRRQGHAVDYILVDGGSSDDTLARIEANRDIVSQWISEPDEGIYDAINKGIMLARGQLIGVLGADDCYEPGALDAVAAAAGTNPAELYAGQTRMIEPDGRISLRADEPYGAGTLVSGIPFGHNAMFVRRDAYARIGLYDTSYRLCADAHWVHRAVKAELSCVQLPQVVVNFALSGASSTDPERILAESDRTIQANFPFLSAEEARRTLYSVRGWAGDEQLLPILARHEDPAYREALRTALAVRPGRPVRLEALIGETDLILPEHTPFLARLTSALSAFMLRRG